MCCFFDVPKFLKPWSKESGVKYDKDLDDGEDRIHVWLANKPMVDLTLFEVMQRVIYVTKYAKKPLMFSERMCATWTILVGKHYDVPKLGITSKGLLDYLIFPLVARKLMCDCDKDTPIKNGAALAVVFPLEILRVFIGLVLLAVLTLTVLPVVHALDCLVSCFMLPDNDDLDEEVDIDPLLKWNTL